MITHPPKETRQQKERRLEGGGLDRTWKGGGEWEMYGEPSSNYVIKDKSFTKDEVYSLKQLWDGKIPGESCIILRYLKSWNEI